MMGLVVIKKRGAGLKLANVNASNHAGNYGSGAGQVQKSGKNRANSGEFVAIRKSAGYAAPQPVR